MTQCNSAIVFPFVCFFIISITLELENASTSWQCTLWTTAIFFLKPARNSEWIIRFSHLWYWKRELKHSRGNLLSISAKFNDTNICISNHMTWTGPDLCNIIWQCQDSFANMILDGYFLGLGYTSLLAQRRNHTIRMWTLVQAFYRTDPSTSGC